MHTTITKILGSVQLSAILKISEAFDILTLVDLQQKNEQEAPLIVANTEATLTFRIFTAMYYDQYLQTAEICNLNKLVKCIIKNQHNDVYIPSIDFDNDSIKTKHFLFKVGEKTLSKEIITNELRNGLLEYINYKVRLPDFVTQILEQEYVNYIRSRRYAIVATWIKDRITTQPGGQGCIHITTIHSNDWERQVLLQQIIDARQPGGKSKVVHRLTKTKEIFIMGKQKRIVHVGIRGGKYITVFAF
jgi:hypothetical protein